VREGVDCHFYSLHREIAISAARRKRKEGAGLSLHDRRAQGLELTLEEEKLLASTDKWQVNMLCVYTQVMSIVYACMKVLMTIFTRYTGKLHLVLFGANTRRVCTTSKHKA